MLSTNAARIDLADRRIGLCWGATRAPSGGRNHRGTPFVRALLLLILAFKAITPTWRPRDTNNTPLSHRPLGHLSTSPGCWRAA
jgi:hypothetical protein